MTDASKHFSTEAAGEPAGPGRYVHIDKIASAEFVPGLTFRPVLGQRAMANFVHFDPGAEAPRHVHEEEQIVIILEGEMTFDLDGDVRTMRKGDVAVIPAWVPHGAWTTDTTCLEVDVFCPPRQTLLDLAGVEVPDSGARQRLMDLSLSGRRAIVTGGSKGLGRAIAAELLAEGVQVVICSRNEAELDETAAELGKDGGTVTAIRCDVTDPDQVTGFVDEAASALGGGVDILVNNAGGARPGRFETLSDADWQADFEVKVLSQIRCTRAALPRLRHSAAPRVININAVYGRYPDPGFLASSVNRASCLSLAKALAFELGHEGILVNSVNIGFVTTPQWENIHRRRAPDRPAEEFFAQLAASEVPLGRFGRPDEVAGLVAFLAGDRASYITGASIDVAGGMGKYL